MNHLSFRRAFFLSVSLYPSILFAQDAAVTPVPPEAAANTAEARQLEPVVVTANRVDTPVSQVTSSLTVLTHQELEQRQPLTAYDALGLVPGMDLVRSGGPGQTTSIYTRGANDDATLVMMDGIPLNDPINASRSYDYLDQVPLDGIDRIEVVRGPQSALYGSAAMAGVVNLITRPGAGPLGGSLLLEGGAYGTLREQAQAQGGDDALHFSLTASRFDTDGFPTADRSFGNTLNSPDNGTDGILEVGGSPAAGLSTDLLVRYGQSRTNLADGGGAGGQDPNYWADQKQLVLGSRSKLEWGDWEQVWTASFVDDDRLYTDSYDPAYPASADQVGHYDGQMAQVGWQNNWRIAPEETVILGLQGYKEWGYSSYAYLPYPADEVSANAEMGSAYLQSQTKVGERFFLNLGGRLDAHDQFGTHGTWQAGTAYFIPGMGTKLSANLGTGFEAPDLYQLYDPTYGNKSLEPQTSLGFDAGFEQPLGKLRVGATYFDADYSDLFGFTTQYVNVDRARTQGVEAFAALAVKDLSLRADYTYLDAKDLGTGRPLLRRPAHQATLDAAYDLGDAELGATAAYVGARQDTYFDLQTYTSSDETLPAYFLVGLRGSLELDAHWKLFARLDNLLDEHYEEVFGYGTPGRSFYGGVKVSL